MKFVSIALTVWFGVVPLTGGVQRVGTCAEWTAPRRVGALDATFVNEASGLAFSSRFPERLYHVNDSGDRGRFYITDQEGGETRATLVEGFRPRDVEDMDVGDCGLEDASCLFLADIGDNGRRRGEVEIVLVREEERFSDRVAPLHRIRLRYPDGARDAESIAVHPNGDLFLLSKTTEFWRLRAGPSVLYRVPYAMWAEPDGGVLTPQQVGEIDLTRISSDPFSGSLPTGMDISADGRRLLILTYLNAFEFYLDVSVQSLKPMSDMIAGVDYQEIDLTPADLPRLEQQESIAYLPAGNGFLYTTEAGSRDFAPLMRVSCQQ
jgi:hypothetical protein